MGEAAHRVSLVASGKSQTIEGQVRITATDVLAAYILPPFIGQLYDIAPNLEIDIVASNDIRDLQRREADIAIRHVRSEQANLIAKLVREEKAYLYASEKYLEVYGHPKSIADTANHKFLNFGEADEMIHHYEGFGLALSKENFRFGSENGVVVWEMAKHGYGICPMSEEVGLNTPGMVHVYKDMKPILFPIWLMAHSEVHKSRRIRLVYDLLAEFLSKGPVR